MSDEQMGVSNLPEEIRRAVKRDPTAEPTMPGLSGHFPETEYHGAARYHVECDCGFKTEPTNYYVAKAEWAQHALSTIPAQDALVGECREALKLAQSLCGQVKCDLSSAHAEICKLQKLDPATHTWPEWSPQANTLRWIDNKIAPQIDALIAKLPAPPVVVEPHE